jgi:apolipoprotein N-acyltransferase
MTLAFQAGERSAMEKGGQRLVVARGTCNRPNGPRGGRRASSVRDTVFPTHRSGWRAGAHPTVTAAGRRAPRPSVNPFSAKLSAKNAALGASLVLSAYGAACAAQGGLPLWVGWVALVPVFVAIRALRPILAMLCGALWGASLFVFTSGASEPGHPLVVGLLLTVVPAAYAYLAAYVTRWIGFSPFVLGVGWMGVELALAPVGLHNGLLSATQGDTALMDYIGRALGYVLVAFLVAYINALLVEVLGRVPLRLPRPRWAAARDDAEILLRSQIVGCLSLVALQPSHPRAPPHRSVPTDSF